MLPELYKSRNRLIQPKLIYPAIYITLPFEPKMMVVSALEQRLRLIVEKAEQQITGRRPHSQSINGCG